MPVQGKAPAWLNGFIHVIWFKWLIIKNILYLHVFKYSLFFPKNQVKFQALSYQLKRAFPLAKVRWWHDFSFGGELALYEKIDSFHDFGFGNKGSIRLSTTVPECVSCRKTGR